MRARVATADTARPGRKGQAVKGLRGGLEVAAKQPRLGHPWLFMTPIFARRMEKGIAFVRQHVSTAETARLQATRPRDR